MRKITNRHSIAKRASVQWLLAAILVGAIARPADAQVPVCEALTLYGNAANSGLCHSLSPANQNLWVCELTQGNPDIHLTFNAVAALHITVRQYQMPPVCQGNSNLAGNWHQGLTNLAIANGQQGVICGTNVINYMARLNNVPMAPHGNNASACTAGFIAALAVNRLTPQVAQTYIDECNRHRNGIACP